MTNRNEWMTILRRLFWVAGSMSIASCVLDRGPTAQECEPRLGALIANSKTAMEEVRPARKALSQNPHSESARAEYHAAEAKANRTLPMNAREARYLCR